MFKEGLMESIIPQIFLHLSENEKSNFYTSLNIIQTKIDDFVRVFYRHFLQTEVKSLFKDVNLEEQYKMFRVSLAIIISYIDNPYLLNKHLKLVVENHKKYGVRKEHIHSFIESFMLSLYEFIGNDNKEILDIWDKIINKIMKSFEDQI